MISVGAAGALLAECVAGAPPPFGGAASGRPRGGGAVLVVGQKLFCINLSSLGYRVKTATKTRGGSSCVLRARCVRAALQHSRSCVAATPYLIVLA
jgi:hypothetical protein